jgi:hypothetical protein
VALLAVAALAGAAVEVACRQALGIQDLAVSEAGASEGGAGEGGAGDAGAAAAACHAKTTTEDCYSCCALIDGGDLGFFHGDVHDCVCSTECADVCLTYCGPTAPADSTDCDLCVFLESFQSLGDCYQRAAAAGQATRGASTIYQCLAGCAPPSDSECASLATRDGCYDCCSGQHVAALQTLFGSAGQACACDAGCGPVCPSYCPTSSSDTYSCTQCVLGTLIDGGCASTGAALCSNPDCKAMATCMQACAQTQ